MTMGWYGWREGGTRGVLVAGRSLDVSDLTRGKVLALCEAIDAVAARAGLEVESVPADMDLTDEGSGDDDETFGCVFVGRLVAEGGTLEPLAVDRAAMLSALAEASAFPAALWDAISAAHRETGSKMAVEEEGLIRLRLASTGPLPMAYLAFGRVGAEDAGLGGRYLCGQGPDQSRHAVGVHGLSVAHCSYDGSSAQPFAMDDAAHAEREAAHPGGGYFLIARFD
jgi:hypothetical protein